MDVVLPRTPPSQLDELYAKLQYSVTIPEGDDCWFNSLPEPAYSNKSRRRTRKESALSFLQGLYGQSCGRSRRRRPMLQSPDGGLILSYEHRERSERPLGERSLLLMYLSIVLNKSGNGWSSQSNSGSEHLDSRLSRIVRTMRGIMDGDPRCRFVFGLEFENKIVRLWFVSRTTTLVSTPFEDWCILVRVFVALGTADRATLGHDDTVRLVKDKGGNYLYDVSVDNTTFRTMKSLFDTYSDFTCVWTVKEVRDREAAGKHFRLEDHWPLPSN
uniref:Fungal-type protein kinase domain-containing protein n=1 Tax=Moniliophthora roreri TaxID=221103 RepID=A0A0W0F323_MONRR